MNPANDFGIDRPLDGLDGIGSGHAVVECDELGGHLATGGVGFVLSESAQLLRGLLLDVLENLLLHFFGCQFQEVGSLVGGHQLDQFREPLLPDAFEERSLRLLVGLVQNDRDHVVIQCREDRQALLLVEVLHGDGDVDGVFPAKTITELRR